MPPISLQLVVFLLGVCGLTTAAAVWDLRTRRIPNKLTIPAFLAGLVYQAAFNGLGRPGLADAGLAFLLGFGTLFVLWLIGGGGGGDVKLMGALSVWLGFRLTLLVMICSVICVLVGTLLVMVWSVITRGAYATKRKYTATGKGYGTGKGRKKKTETVAQRQKRRIMAYALPVALSTWAVVFWKLPMFPF
ncbi:MAG: prepilin peptidase [Planctomycetes bacterium]|nr:prepilin peptidase [Planctomycetota bacterium]